jgi:hypothetical protein
MHSGRLTFCTVCSRSRWSRTGPPHRPSLFPVPALCSTPRGERASDCREALCPDGARCAAARRADKERRVLHAAAPQARGATRSALCRASIASTPRSHPLRRASIGARKTRSVTVGLSQQRGGYIERVLTLSGDRHRPLEALTIFFRHQQCRCANLHACTCEGLQV